MTRKMLIDAAQNEEIRVAVVDGKKVEDFDFESSTRKPLRGNIYLARVTRVEPSLQAAFVEYGGNRHGFLAFSEIHPDYYQIPVSDREVLQGAEQKMTKLADELEIFQNGEDEEDENNEDNDDASQNASDDKKDDDKNVDGETEESPEEAANSDSAEASNEGADSADFVSTDFVSEDSDSDTANQETIIDTSSNDKGSLELDGDLAEIVHEDTAHEDSVHADNDEADAPSDALLKSDDLPTVSETLTNDQEDDDSTETISDENTDGENTGSENNTEQSEANTKKAKRKSQYATLLENYHEARRNHARILRNYKIQEVVKARQILLVQVVKEERGNKGAALTSYMSLAGRYCVLMPNTARGGGISRKIPSAADRKRLRRVVNELDVTQGMGLIIRTAGAKRTKSEIKRDYDYLLRLWETIRNLTMDSVAPSLIYEEASLIKRAIRDLYDKDTSRIIVEGEEGYREAKDFMKMLMPSHAKNVQAYRDPSPLFMRFDVEQQLDSMYQPSVRLKSGGYLVIHQTEALIAVDVNSGKATRERNIEATALKTNLEAAQEVARQCKLRDLAGLIVIDFIDMEDMKNNRAVEKRLKESMKGDRARIQIGRISNFGLMEMSRQRRRSGIIDGTTNACPTCNGSGAVRSNEMAALRILRAIENEAISSRSAIIAARTSYDVALYILNHKREWLSRIESQHALNIEIAADPVKAGDQYEIEKRGPARVIPPRTQAVQADLDISVDENGDDEKSSSHSNGPANEGDEQGSGRKRRRRRRRRKGSHEDENAQNAESGDKAEQAQQSDAAPNTSDATNTDIANTDASNSASSDSATNENGTNEDEKPKKRRRRGRRGGGRRNQENAEDTSLTSQQEGQPSTDKADNDDLAGKPEPTATDSVKTDQGETDNGEEKPKRKRASSRKSTKKAKESPQQEGDDSAEMDAPEEKKATRKTTKKRAPRKRTTKATSSDDKASKATSNDDAAVSTEQKVETEKKPERKPRAKKATTRKTATKKAAPAAETETTKPDAAETKPKKDRKGWWQRALGGE